MYRVMVVDDEAAHRKGMVQILNAMKPDYFLLEARDGNMAEMILDTVDVDIILTDIRMPNKDGLEFLADLYRIRHNAKVIIVSGYGQFSYAKTALANGAFDFLLKPIDPEELEEALNRAEKSVEEDKKRKQNYSRYIDLLLVKMVKSELSDKEKEEIDGVLPADAAGLVFTVKLPRRREKTIDFIEWRQKIKQMLDEWGHTIMFEETNDVVSWAGMFFLKPSCSGDNYERILKRIYERMQELVLFGMKFGLSRITENLCENVTDAYAQAVNALSKTFYFSDGGSIYIEEEAETSQEILRLLAEKEDDMANMIRYSEHEEIKKELAEFFSMITFENMPNPNRLKELFVLLGMRVTNLLQKKGVVIDYRPAIAAFTEKIMEAEHLKKLQEEVENIFLLLNDISKEEAGKEDAILLAVRYLEEHFAEEVALTEVAEKLFFTPAYFSICFKKRMGKPFSQYLKDVRMEKACEMLCRTNKKVGTIALETGYSDAAYFGKVFKKCIGCSPEEYRKRNYHI